MVFSTKHGFDDASEERCRSLGFRLAGACGFEIASSEEGEVMLRPPGLYGCLSYPDWRHALGGGSRCQKPFVDWMLSELGEEPSIQALRSFLYSSPDELELKLEAAGR